MKSYVMTDHGEQLKQLVSDYPDVFAEYVRLAKLAIAEENAVILASKDHGFLRVQNYTPAH